jgi:hypothetical protein
LLGIVMGLIYMNDANLSKKATGKTWLKVGVGLMVFYAIVPGPTAGRSHQPQQRGNPRAPALR